jgi:hypothetical protein
VATIQPAKRIDLALSSQFDGTGITDANKAGVSITAGTTADPVVCTATGHPYVTGDWVFIDGATGTTEINGLREVVKIDANTFSLLDEAGDAVGSAGTFGGTVDSHYAFGLQAPASGAQKWTLARMNGLAADASALIVDGMLGVARLTNGIIVKVYDASEASYTTLTALPIKGWNDWALVVGGSDAYTGDIANNKIQGGIRWTFNRNAEGSGHSSPIVLQPGDFIVVYSQDDLDGLSALRFSVQGWTN